MRIIRHDVRKSDGKMSKSCNILEKNYHFMMKEYENISSNSARNNIANYRIIKNMLVINSLIGRVKKKHILKIFEKIDSDIILILKKNSSIFILKLLASFYIKLCTYGKFNICERYNVIFDNTLCRNVTIYTSELKGVHENLMKNTFLFTSLVLFQLREKVIPNVAMITEYASKHQLREDHVCERDYVIPCILFTVCMFS
ncbi:hypothetical protein POWCR01_140016400 [Plasmodium ovale]|uniref:Uncharacterized protein n=1 Tax=Plasmodium ovale TaxID=36330 RepID=A0A1C3L4N5_PLAOA|nr:hypothetical protein POWCR01_140016400 [Plasmodium ovale]